MQTVSRLLAITLERWGSRRAAQKEQSIAAAPSAAPSEVLPLTQIGYQHFTLHRSLPAQAIEEWALP